VLNSERDISAVADAEDAAAFAGLRYVSDTRPGFRRRKSSKNFRYLRPNGSRLSDAIAVKRIGSLAIPPAWTDVWICPFADGHIQATGRDARGRKQYRYHPRFREVRDSTKYAHVLVFARLLPSIREKVSAHMALPGLPREKIVATVVCLLDKTLIRVGNDDYAKQNKSYGLTTLKNRHVEVHGSEVRFEFVGKSGKQWTTKIRDRRVAKIIRACQELPGQELLQYRAEDGNIEVVTSSDVNAYLQEITGYDVTAKDFRTWAGTVLAALALKEVATFDSETQAKKNVRAAIDKVAARLGNTPAICRKCYVHPEVLETYLEGMLVDEMAPRSETLQRDRLAGLEPEEAAILGMLSSRLQSAKRRARGGVDKLRPQRPLLRSRRVTGSKMTAAFRELKVTDDANLNGSKKPNKPTTAGAQHSVGL
jgi:DNA topoisomerase-1